MILFEHNNNILNLIIFYLNYNKHVNSHIQIILKSHNITHRLSDYQVIKVGHGSNLRLLALLATPDAYVEQNLQNLNFFRH
jgi:hypothetical protein